MTYEISNLADLGWHTFFSSQLDTTDLDAFIPVKVIEVHRSKLRVIGLSIDCGVPPFYVPDGGDEAAATVGDWLLLDKETMQPQRLLTRKSLFKRLAAGKGRKTQLIVANVDTLFVVTSCNQDFNIPRLERYLILAREAGVTPVIVLTKADLADNPEEFASRARELQPGLLVETVNALDPESIQNLAPWCAQGQTVAFLGSSGVGKSTLINTLLGTEAVETQGIRQDDKGRHTTTVRTLHHLPQGGWLLDTPGMRELGLTDVATGLDDVFEDIQELAQQCRFNDCAHETEPGCAVRSAIETGELDPDRLKRWRKLSAEELHNTESLAERHTRNRTFGKMIKRVKQQKSRK